MCSSCKKVWLSSESLLLGVFFFFCLILEKNMLNHFWGYRKACSWAAAGGAFPAAGQCLVSQSRLSQGVRRTGRTGAGDVQSALQRPTLLSDSARGTGPPSCSGGSLYVTHLVKLQLLYRLSQTLSILRNPTITANQIPENTSSDQLCRSEDCECTFVRALALLWEFQAEASIKVQSIVIIFVLYTYLNSTW